jgi:hypothetical protein
MALADERNRELLERDLRYAWWNNHAVVDAAIGSFIDYGTKVRRKDREKGLHPRGGAVLRHRRAHARISAEI